MIQFLLLVMGLSFSRVEEVNLDQLQSRIHTTSDTTYVVNFWATWCRPCIEELPAFEALSRKYSSEPVVVILVSLDQPQDRLTKVEPFIRRRGYTRSSVVLLNQPKPHLWIDQVDSAWSGSIPATLFIRGNRRLFGEFQFGGAQLDSTFQSFREGRQ
ncbi:MAG TPA: redoxin [Bacteroidetes bacterium]|nr:redoxin [Bacteroidota bacterium]